MKETIKETPFRSSRDDYYMPDTNKQGWGSIFGVKTQVTETEDNGVRTITRTPL